MSERNGVFNRRGKTGSARKSVNAAEALFSLARTGAIAPVTLVVGAFLLAGGLLIVILAALSAAIAPVLTSGATGTTGTGGTSVFGFGGVGAPFPNACLTTSQSSPCLYDDHTIIAAWAYQIAEHAQSCQGQDKCFVFPPANTADRIAFAGTYMPVPIIKEWEQECPIGSGCFGDWQNGSLQCVLLPTAAYQLAGIQLPAVGNASDFPYLYANRPGWQEISATPTNSGLNAGLHDSDALPRAGDMIVWSSPDNVYGHIAVVLSATPPAQGDTIGAISFAETNGPGGDGTHPGTNGVDTGKIIRFVDTSGNIVYKMAPRYGGGDTSQVYIRYVGASPTPVVSSESSFACQVLPFVYEANLLQRESAAVKGNAWNPSVILAVWGEETNWRLPGATTAYNVGNPLGAPTDKPPDLWQGTLDFAATSLLASYAGIPQGGPSVQQQVTALTASGWNLPAPSIGSTSGQELLATIQRDGLSQFDITGSSCASAASHPSWYEPLYPVQDTP